MFGFKRDTVIRNKHLVFMESTEELATELLSFMKLAGLGTKLKRVITEEDVLLHDMLLSHNVLILQMKKELKEEGFTERGSARTESLSKRLSLFEFLEITQINA